MQKFFSKHLAGHKMHHFGQKKALHPDTILKIYSDGIGTPVQDMIVALCRRIAILELIVQISWLVSILILSVLIVANVI